MNYRSNGSARHLNEANIQNGCASILQESESPLPIVNYLQHAGQVRRENFKKNKQSDISHENFKGIASVGKYFLNMEEVMISIEQFRFSPTWICIHRGTKVTWQVKCNRPNYNSIYDQTGPRFFIISIPQLEEESDPIHENESFSLVLEQIGTFDMICQNYMRMKGSLIVVDPSVTLADLTRETHHKGCFMDHVDDFKYASSSAKQDNEREDNIPEVSLHSVINKPIVETIEQRNAQIIIPYNQKMINKLAKVEQTSRKNDQLNIQEFQNINKMPQELETVPVIETTTQKREKILTIVNDGNKAEISEMVEQEKIAKQFIQELEEEQINQQSSKKQNAHYLQLYKDDFQEEIEESEEFDDTAQKVGQPNRYQGKFCNEMKSIVGKYVNKGKLNEQEKQVSVRSKFVKKDLEKDEMKQNGTQNTLKQREKDPLRALKASFYDKKHLNWSNGINKKIKIRHESNSNRSSSENSFTSERSRTNSLIESKRQAKDDENELTQKDIMRKEGERTTRQSTLQSQKSKKLKCSIKKEEKVEEEKNIGYDSDYEDEQERIISHQKVPTKWAHNKTQSPKQKENGKSKHSKIHEINKSCSKGEELKQNTNNDEEEDEEYDCNTIISEEDASVILTSKDNSFVLRRNHSSSDLHSGSSGRNRVNKSSKEIGISGAANRLKKRFTKHENMSNSQQSIQKPSKSSSNQANIKNSSRQSNQQRKKLNIMGMLSDNYLKSPAQSILTTAESSKYSDTTKPLSHKGDFDLEGAEIQERGGLVFHAQKRRASTDQTIQETRYNNCCSANNEDSDTRSIKSLKNEPVSNTIQIQNVISIPNAISLQNTAIINSNTSPNISLHNNYHTPLHQSQRNLGLDCRSDRDVECIDLFPESDPNKFQLEPRSSNSNIFNFLQQHAKLSITNFTQTLISQKPSQEGDSNYRQSHNLIQNYQTNSQLIDSEVSFLQANISLNNETNPQLQEDIAFIHSFLEQRYEVENWLLSISQDENEEIEDY